MSDRSRRRKAIGAGGETSDFDRLGELLPAAVSGRTLREGTESTGQDGVSGDRASRGPAVYDDPNRRVAAVWAEAVGADVAANARPVQLREGRLVVTTSSSAWAQTLQLMSPMVAAGLNDRLGERLVERVVFRHAGWEGPAAPPSTDVAVPEPPLGPDHKADEAFTAEELQALADLEREPLEPAMKSRIREAMRAGFIRARQDSGRS